MRTNSLFVEPCAPHCLSALKLCTLLFFIFVHSVALHMVVSTRSTKAKCTAFLAFAQMAHWWATWLHYVSSRLDILYFFSWCLHKLFSGAPMHCGGTAVMVLGSQLERCRFCPDHRGRSSAEAKREDTMFLDLGAHERTTGGQNFQGPPMWHAS